MAHFFLSPLTNFGLLGEKVDASLSPYLHNKALAILGESKSYQAFSLSPSQIGATLATLHRRKIRGLNITIPYKQKVLQYVSLQDTLVQSLSVANTLIWEPKGYRALNTDVWGFEKSLEGLPPLLGKSCVVLGAGGAARAVLSVLLKKQVKQIILINRSLDRLQALQEQFKHAPSLQCYTSDDPQLQTLSGLHGLIHASSAQLFAPVSLSFSQLHPSAFVYDLNYTKEGTTPLIAAARACGFKAQDGRRMLAAQAAKAMALWLGKDLDTLYAIYRESLRLIP